MAKDTKTTVKTKKAEKEPKIELNLLKPRATEKAYLEQAKRTCIFFVEDESSKQAIKARVEKDYNVKVTDVRVLTRKGHACRFARGKGKFPGTAMKRDRRLAYVTLAEGNSIKVFETPEDNKKADAKEAKAAKKAEKVDKNAGKENN